MAQGGEHDKPQQVPGASTFVSQTLHLVVDVLGNLSGRATAFMAFVKFEA